MLLSKAQTPDSLNRQQTTTDTVHLASEMDTLAHTEAPTAGTLLKNVVLSTPGDFVQMGKALSNNWWKTAAYAGGIAIMIWADKPVTQWYQDHVETTVKYKLPALPGAKNSFIFNGNDAYLNYSILGLYGGSLIGNYKTGQRAALNSMKALAYSYFITQVTLKFIFARQRPDPTLSDGKPPVKPYTDDPHKFFNFRKLNFDVGPNGTSFPSMHATAYYAVAKVMAMEFHNYWIPYTAVTFLFLANIDSHQHWVGDMVTGGLLGSLIGQGIVTSSRIYEKKHQQSLLNRHHKSSFNYQVIPAVSSNMMGLGLHVSL